jgi:fused signal recognition particle receptor
MPEGFEDLCRGAGVDPVCEHGTWRGEVLGLEVVRATEAGFETGVGRFDREASALLHGDLPTSESLAAAADQLSLWAERVGVTVVRGAEGADPGSVVFDAVEHAAAQGADLVLADTAGRVHTRQNLMDELSKVRRVAEKGAGTVTETLLVLDAITGQNGLVQARQFTEAADVTGLVLTKLDGSAKGGIVLAVEAELGLPVKLVGVGEGPDDLLPFDPADFVDALFE